MKKKGRRSKPSRTKITGYIDLPRHPLNNCAAALVGMVGVNTRVRLLEGRGDRYPAGREVNLLPGVFIKDRRYPKRLSAAEFRAKLDQLGVTPGELAAAMDESLELIEAAMEAGVEDDPDLMMMRDWFDGFEACARIAEERYRGNDQVSEGLAAASRGEEKEGEGDVDTMVE